MEMNLGHFKTWGNVRCGATYDMFARSLTISHNSEADRSLGNSSSIDLEERT